MPQYDYRCPKCGELFETIVPIRDMDNVNCPRCCIRATRTWAGRAPGLVFNGGGWTRNESGWRSMQKEQAESKRNFEARMREEKAKAWEKALNESRPWNDQDHADHEAAVKARREKRNGPNAPALAL